MNQYLPAILVFVMVSSAMLLVYLLFSKRTTQLDERLSEAFSEDGGANTELIAVKDFAKVALPKMGNAILPTDEAERTRLQSRLIQAGLYGRQAMPIFLGIKLLVMLGPAALGLVAGVLGLVSIRGGVIGGGCFGVLGMIGPSFWLDTRKKARQTLFRRALPDTLDVLVICLEGGLSLSGGLRRIATDLRTAHPLLAYEINIVQREILLGRSPGEALQQMAVRADLEEIRSLASVINQSERFGASLVKSLRIHAEMLREKRKQHAEELAQKAGTKIMIPTLFFIFPAMFVVILGPAAFQIIELMGMMQR